MKNRDFFSSLFWLAMGAGVCYGGYDLELGTLHDPGSGFMFFWVGIIMLGLSLFIFIRAMRDKKKEGEGKVLWSQVKWRKNVYVVAALFLYAYAFSPLGFILSTVLLLIFLFKAVEPQRWTVAILASFLSTLTSYAVFHLWLGTQLPRGFLGIG
jgi:putative tricarboxylic transport membrane protein